MDDKVIKAIGIVTTIVGVGVQLVSGWVQDKNMDAKINEKVLEAITKQTTK